MLLSATPDLFSFAPRGVVNKVLVPCIIRLTEFPDTDRDSAKCRSIMLNDDFVYDSCFQTFFI